MGDFGLLFLFALLVVSFSSPRDADNLSLRVENVCISRRGTLFYCTSFWNLQNPVPAKIIGKAELGLPNMLCSETFLAIGPFESEDEAKSVIKYTQTKFFRILVGARKLKNMTSGTYKFVPLQDFTNNSDID